MPLGQYTRKTRITLPFLRFHLAHPALIAALHGLRLNWIGRPNATIPRVKISSPLSHLNHSSLSSQQPPLLIHPRPRDDRHRHQQQTHRGISDRLHPRNRRRHYRSLGQEESIQIPSRLPTVRPSLPSLLLHPSYPPQQLCFTLGSEIALRRPRTYNSVCPKRPTRRQVLFHHPIDFYCTRTHGHLSHQLPYRQVSYGCIFTHEPRPTFQHWVRTRASIQPANYHCYDRGAPGVEPLVPDRNTPGARQQRENRLFSSHLSSCQIN